MPNDVMSVLARTSFTRTLEVIQDELHAQGFRILAEVDMSAAAHEETGTRIAPYVLLSVHDPQLTAKAISDRPEVGLLLPCSVAVREDAGRSGGESEGGAKEGETPRTIVEAVCPSLTPRFTGDGAPGALAAIAADLGARLERVLASVGDLAPPAAAPVDDLLVRHLEGDRFSIAIRRHLLLIDQPKEAGGDDLAPTPTELFVAGLAGCVAYYARRYLHRHGLPATGLAVSTTYRLASGPTRVDAINVVISPPVEMPAGRRAGLLAVASHCTVHNSLQQPPRVAIELAAEP